MQVGYFVVAYGFGFGLWSYLFSLFRLTWFTVGFVVLLGLPAVWSAVWFRVDILFVGCWVWVMLALAVC